MNGNEGVRPVVLMRLKGRFEELRLLGAESKPDAARALRCCGDLLRRSDTLSTGERDGVSDQVGTVLRALSSDAIAAFARTVDLEQVELRIRRAAEEAVEAAVPESPEDRDTWAAWAKEGLELRDALESQLHAMQAREGLGFARDRAVRERLQSVVDAQDRALRGRSRWLVGLNDFRRAERDALDAAHRAHAWWFSDRADCDDLLPLLAGEPLQSAHVKTCAECQRDLGAVKAANAPRTRHLSEDDLWAFDLGTMSAQERIAVDAHVRICGECARAIAALDEGEETIRELTATVTSTATAGRTSTVTTGGNPVVDLNAARARLRTDEPEVLATHADFRLLLFRRSQRVTLVVQPAQPGRIAAAAVFVPAQPDRALTARPGPDGYEVEMPEALRVHGTARVRVKLTGSTAREIEQDIALSRR